MVNATEWINQNYPINGTCQRKEDKDNYGKTRNQITELDVSNQNLEGGLDFSTGGFANLRKLNFSFNKLNFAWWPSNYMEEMDFSHNLFNGNQVGWPDNPKIKKLNFSYNNWEKVFIRNAPRLTHLDVSGNNALNTLDLRGSESLIELNCLANPLLVNFSFSSLSNLKSFDCLGVKFTKSDNANCPTTTSLATATVYTNNPALLGSTIGLGVYSGISTLGWITLGIIFFYKSRLWKTVIPTAGS